MVDFVFSSSAVGFFVLFWDNRAIRGCFRMTLRIVHTFLDISVFPQICGFESLT